jgi:hypothetical protein
VSGDDYSIAPFQARGDQSEPKRVEPARHAHTVGGTAIIGKHLFELREGRPVRESAGRDQGGDVAENGPRKVFVDGVKVQKRDNERGPKGRLAHCKYTLVVCKSA